jgi:GNAT superfamily N-acetyltransferase
MSVVVRSLGAAELEDRVQVLVELLQDAVDAGAGLGFLPPLDLDEARAYWYSLRPELQAGTRVLMVAYLDDRIVGTGQLTNPPWATGRHRAEVQKVMVASAWRGRGVGAALMSALHAWAWQRGRSLVMLNTRRGTPAEAFYTALGYRRVGVVPGYSVGPAGERYDTLQLYQELSFPMLLAS